MYKHVEKRLCILVRAYYFGNEQLYQHYDTKVFWHMNANQSLINVEFVMIYLVDIGRTNLKGYARMHDRLF
jgi:hypothetical protein